MRGRCVKKKDIISKRNIAHMRRRLQKSPNFDEASIVPRGKGGSREDAPSLGVQRAQRRAAQHAEGVRARINERAGVTPEMAARIDPKLQALEEERAESIAAAREIGRAHV